VASQGRAGPYSYGMRRRPAIQTDSSARGLGPFFKRWTIPVIGAITPVGLIVVNIAAFVSSMMLNSWFALNLYRVVQRRRPDHSLVQDRNQEMVLVGGVGVVIIASFLAALFCYLGLNDPKSLPNAPTFLSGAVAIAIPIVAQGFFSRARGTRRPGNGPDPRVTPGPRGTPGGGTQSQSQSQSHTQTGYTPPRYLPPS